MAISLPPQTATYTITPMVRTYRIVINSPFADIPTITIQRENVTVANGQILARGATSTFSPDFTKLASDTVTVNDVTVTTQQVYDFIAAFCDKWHQAYLAQVAADEAAQAQAGS